MRKSALSEKGRALFLDARHGGALPEADGEGWAGSLESGRFVRVQVRLHPDERVAEARFGAPGCAFVIAAAEWAADWATGRTPQEVAQLTASDLLTDIGGLPTHRRYSAAQAVEALQKAVADARNRRGMTL